MRLFRTDRGGNPIPWRRKNRTGRPPLLFHLVRTGQWENVVRRARTHPHEIGAREDGSADTALHMACRLDPPPHVVRALESTVSCQNAEGATPLHLAAANRCSKPVIQVLLHNHPNHNHGAARTNDDNHNNNNNNSAVVVKPPAAVLTRAGRAPIHYACMSYRGLRLDAFRVLLEATLQTGLVPLPEPEDLFLLEDLMEDVVLDDDYHNNNDDNDNDDDDGSRFGKRSLDDPYLCRDTTVAVAAGAASVASPSNNDCPVMINVITYRDNSGQTPLGLLFRRYRERVRLTIQTMERWRREGLGPSRLAAALTIHADLGELWEKARCIVTRLTEEGLPRRLSNIPLLDNEYYGPSDHDNDDHQHYGRYNNNHHYMPSSPGEVVVAQEAARWALEHHSPSIRRTTTTDGASSSSTTTTTTVQRRPFRIVHASVSLTGFGCPPEMIRLAVSIHPNQVQEMDDEGNLPLHIACMAPSLVSNSALLDDDTVSILSDLSFLSNTTSATTSTPNAFDKVIQILLQQYPAAARTPHGSTGRLPLVLAWDRRTWNDGIHTLLDAYPAALESQKKIPLSLYPHILHRLGRTTTAATTSSFVRKRQKRTKRALNSVMELLRAKPNLFIR